MNDIQNLHLLGAKYWTLLSWQKWISSRDQKNKRRRAGNRAEEARGASCGEERPRGSGSSLYFGAAEADIQQNVLSSWEYTSWVTCPGINFPFSLQWQLNINRAVHPKSFQIMAHRENGTHCMAHHSTPARKQVSSWVPQKPAIQLIRKDWLIVNTCRTLDEAGFRSEII